MKKPAINPTLAATGRPPNPRWQLRLYVIAQTPKSVAALANLTEICETHLPHRYRIKVIDLLKQPHLARNDQIFAVPTVVRQLPSPVRTMIGNLSDTARVLFSLGLPPADQPALAP